MTIFPESGAVKDKNRTFSGEGGTASARGGQREQGEGRTSLHDIDAVSNHNTHAQCLESPAPIACNVSVEAVAKAIKIIKSMSNLTPGSYIDY